MNRVALISGASRGIGKAIALELAKSGRDVALIYTHNADAAEQVRQEAEAMGVRAEKYACDVADFDACAATVKKILEDMGKISVLVNNAGTTRDMLAMRMKEDDFDRVINVNLKGAFNLIRHTCSMIMRSDCGRIINVSSVVGISGNAGQANYAASKAGIIGLTKSVAKEFAARGVTCNAIAPGYIDTDMTAAIPDDKKEALLSMVPAKRAGKACEVAKLVAFLASEQAGYITGAVIPIDGGMSM